MLYILHRILICCDGEKWFRVRIEEVGQLYKQLMTTLDFEYPLKPMKPYDVNALIEMAKSKSAFDSLQLLENYRAVAKLRSELLDCDSVPQGLLRLLSELPRDVWFSANLLPIVQFRLYSAVQRKELPWRYYRCARQMSRSVTQASELTPRQAFDYFVQYVSGNSAMQDSRFVDVSQAAITPKLAHFMRVMREPIRERGYCAGFVAMDMFAMRNFSLYVLIRRCLLWLQSYDTGSLRQQALSLMYYRQSGAALRQVFKRSPQFRQAMRLYELISMLTLLQSPQLLQQNQGSLPQSAVAQLYGLVKPDTDPRQMQRLFRLRISEVDLSALQQWFEKSAVLQSHTLIKLSYSRWLPQQRHVSNHAVELRVGRNSALVFYDSNIKRGAVRLKNIDQLIKRLRACQIGVPGKRSSLRLEVYRFTTEQAPQMACLSSRIKLSAHQAAVDCIPEAYAGDYQAAHDLLQLVACEHDAFDGDERAAVLHKLRADMAIEAKPPVAGAKKRKGY